ncbi:MAG: AAA family ATPase [Cellulosilyticum sp.]|nr:AAA family ATPase [Cellulosilyticum sp.]
MKPIKLVIKGLNSFIEEQTIDFNKLTDRGLFGIFGPTGSGKSTILDGITLALYGDIARKSSNFINTNCNDLNISFTFQISGTPNRIYVVNRHFRRDKKTGNAKTHSVMVKEITDGNEEVLAESVTTVNKTCKEILGLSQEDFTRTVVLPQGKFSEFLKLEGKQRREMLERLFNLQDYGEKLAQKLSKQMKAENDEANKILGELNSYEGISDEKLDEEKKHLAELTNTLKIAKEKRDEVESRYKKGEEIWTMQNELTEYKVRQAQLEGQAEQIESQIQKVKQGESAAKVYPFLEGCERTKKELKEANEEQVKLDSKQKELSLQKREIEEVYQKVSKEKEEILPELNSRRTQLEEAILETNKLEEVDAFIKRIQDGLEIVVKDINQYSNQEQMMGLQIEKMNEVIHQLQQQENECKIDEAIRTKVQKGLSLNQAYITEKTNLDKNTLTYNETLEIKKVTEKEAADINKRLAAQRDTLKQQLEAQKEHLGQAPITRETLLQKQEQLIAEREKYSRLEKLRAEIKIHKTRLKEYQISKSELEIGFNKKKDELEQLREIFEKAKLENLSHLLRAKLQEGMACPVCGSTTHHLETLENLDTNELRQLEEKLKEAEQDYQKLETENSKLQVTMMAEMTQLNRLEEEAMPLERLFKDQSIEEQEQLFNKLTEALNQFELKKDELDKEIINLKEEQLRLEAKLGQKNAKSEENQRQLVRVEQDLAEGRKRLAEVQEHLRLLKEEVGTENFEDMSQEILQKDRKREEVSRSIQEKVQEKENLTQKREETKQRLNERQVRLGNGVTKFDENQKKRQELLLSIGKRLQVILKSNQGQYQEIEQEIQRIVVFLKNESIFSSLLKGKVTYTSVTSENEVKQSQETEMTSQSVTLETLGIWFTAYPLLGDNITKLSNFLAILRESINHIITGIEQSFIQAVQKKEQIDSSYEQIIKVLVEITTKVEEFTKRLKNEEENLEKQLREENLTEEEVKIYLLPKEEIEFLKKGISEYQEEKSKLSGSIEAIERKLGDVKLEEVEWRNLQDERAQVIEQVEEITKKHINLMLMVKQIEDALAKLGELREKKQKLDHKIAILTDLDKLFKGKKFVGFVAITRLKYVSLEASKKLKEITNGIYGLEVDEDGKFIIRDYKNGGARRDASTLSGGETFLVSLALALALSAEIQLKGTAPLELFFLDEGFGTLDDDLLEVVMSSLERLHHDRLKVGIISHVEAIKNRVPVKLILTPAEAGNGGTKVKLDRS